MGVFEAIASHEQVVFGVDPASGLRTIIAIHSTALGPALGGTRFHPYDSEEAALDDVLRLSEGMTLKSAAAGLDLGGGKAVIIGDPRTMKSERLFRAYGRLVDSLGGRYITAEDVGTTTEDMVLIARETPFVTGLPLAHGGSGDPSPATARGVVAAQQAVAERLWGTRDLGGKTVAIQGVGKVGTNLAERLHALGAELIVADVDPAATRRAANRFGAKVVDLDEIYEVECDIFAPCALGGILDESTIPRLRAQAVCGSANNQLATDEDAERLEGRGILYAPDFVVNAGGVINIAVEMEGYSEARAAAMVDRIYENLRRVFTIADEERINPHEAAVRLARRRIDEIGTLRLRQRRDRA
ncbi:MAG TPA: Glu/Leu/Phe/Val dehydrogenase [Actinobacteria bacterium]|nr:Glu/Leu/Phe/Val dehydrogenase [Actinomycetota bacterium]